MTKEKNEIGLEKLKEALIAKSESEKSRIEKLTEEKIAAITAENQKQVDDILDRANAEAKKIIAEKASKAEALASVESRIDKLKIKHSYIEDVINSARHELENESTEEKLKRYMELFPEIKSGKYTVTPAEGETDLINDLISKSAYKDQLEIGEEGSFRGGFIVANEDFVYDRSYRTIFREKDMELRKLASEALFKEAK